MRRKDILELKRRFKKEQCTFTKVCGCYVNLSKIKTRKVSVIRFSTLNEICKVLEC